MRTISINTKKIKNEIKRLGIPDAQFAKKCNISRQLLFYVLSTGWSGPMTISKIAHGMGVEPKDLLQ